jgi:hypothetical protein
MCSSRGSHRFTVRGSPIRTSTDRGMCAPPRRLSQLTTSFLASARLGIHRVPLVACQPNSAHLQTCSQELARSSLDHHATSPSLGIFFLFICQRASTLRPKPKLQRPELRERNPRSKTLENVSIGENCGGGEGTRTPDPLLAKQVLCQLSYTPTIRCRSDAEQMWWAWEDLNFRPHAYQACALAS